MAEDVGIEPKCATRIVRTIYRGIGNFGNFLATIAGFLIILLTLITICDVCGRFLFNMPILNSYGMCENLLVGIVFLSLTITEYSDRNIKVELVVSRLPKHTQLLLEIISYGIALCILGLCTWRTSISALSSFMIRETDMGYPPIPVYPSKIILFFGFLFLTVTFGVKLVLKVMQVRAHEEGAK